jgi:hypothetical protein
MQTTEITYGRTGQVVEVYFPEVVRDCLGVPSSVTASVYEGDVSNDEDPLFSPVCSVDSVSTTVATTAAGQSQAAGLRNRVTVASASGMDTGVLYLLDNDSLQREVVEPKKIASSVVDLVHDLQYDYPITTSTLKGIRVTFPVDSTWVADEDNILDPSESSYRVRWQYTVAGAVYNLQTYLRLVRKPFRTTVTYRDLVARWPSMLDGQSREMRGDRFRKLIEAAENTVRTDILAEGYKPEQFNDTETIDRLVNLALDYQIARFLKEPTGRDREVFIAESKQEYGQLLGKMISTLKVSIDVSTEGATAPDPVLPYFFRR